MKVNLARSPHKAKSDYLPASTAGVMEFLDFGCGIGKSIAFASSVNPGHGFGLDKSADAVSACRTKGYNAEIGDVLTYDQRNVAAATFAIDLMQELPGRNELTTACVNVVRAARNFAVIQHSNFDIDVTLSPLGLQCESNFGKKIIYKPSIAEYIVFVRSYARSIDIVGLGIFSFGDPVVTPIFDRARQGATIDLSSSRTLRVVIARKDPRRFQQALEKVGIGRTLFVWTKE